MNPTHTNATNSRMTVRVTPDTGAARESSVEWLTSLACLNLMYHQTPGSVVWYLFAGVSLLYTVLAFLTEREERRARQAHEQR